MASPPRPKSVGNVRNASLKFSSCNNSGGWPRSCGHWKWGNGFMSFGMFHSAAHFSPSMSTACWAERGAPNLLISFEIRVCFSHAGPPAKATNLQSCCLRSWSGSSSASGNNVTEGVHPVLIRDIRCCRPNPAAGPSCSQVLGVRDCKTVALPFYRFTVCAFHRLPFGTAAR